MKAKIKDWFYWNGEVVGIIAVVVTLLGLLVLGLAHLSATEIKYNCQLDKRPSYKMALLINTDVHAYAPEKFCADVRERMAKGE